MMEPELKGRVLPFRRVRKPARLAQILTSGTGNSIQEASGTVAARVSVDREVNSEWDTLIRLATQAWSWRDPESLDVLEGTVTRLRTWIGHDWPV